MIKVLGEEERNAKEGSTCGYADGDAKVKRTVREARQSGTQHLGDRCRRIATSLAYKALPIML